jgi:hypothetical protein
MPTTVSTQVNPALLSTSLFNLFKLNNPNLFSIAQPNLSDPVAVSNALPVLLNAIPVAQDGDVITAQYHNSLRDALIVLAAQAGPVLTGQPETYTYAPHFLQNDAGPNWQQAGGLATPDASKSANGFFVVQLPNGARIQNLTVTGRRTGNPAASFTVLLVRVNINDASPVTLISLDLRTAPDPFKVSQSLNVPGAGPAALEEYRLVDTTAFTYLVTARVLGATDIVQINSITISFLSS